MDGPPSYLLKTNLDPSWWMSDRRKVREESLKVQRRGKFWKGALQYRRLHRTCRASVPISNRVFIARVWLAEVECSHVAKVACGGVSDRKMLYEPHHWYIATCISPERCGQHCKVSEWFIALRRDVRSIGIYNPGATAHLNSICHVGLEK
jgi:hypothetical protein